MFRRIDNRHDQYQMIFSALVDKTLSNTEQVFVASSEKRVKDELGGIRTRDKGLLCSPRIFNAKQFRQ